jgi:multicomponent Na+:H+ antiporter subunit D
MRGAGLIDKLGGLAFLVGSLSMIGIPFFAGFVAKVFLSTAALELSPVKLVVTLAALAISTLLNACYYIPAIYTLLNKPLTRPLERPQLKYSFGYVFSIVVFVGLNFFVGIYSSELFTLISQGIAMFG